MTELQIIQSIEESQLFTGIFPGDVESEQEVDQLLAEIDKSQEQEQQIFLSI